MSGSSSQHEFGRSDLSISKSGAQNEDLTGPLSVVLSPRAGIKRLMISHDGALESFGQKI